MTPLAIFSARPEVATRFAFSRAPAALITSTERDFHFLAEIRAMPSRALRSSLKSSAVSYFGKTTWNVVPSGPV